jgi:hypothetical protein
MLSVIAACATTGAEGEGDHNLPSANVGPFRKLGPEEVKGVAPFVLDDKGARYREPTVLRDGEFTLLYAVARVSGKDVIVRTRSLDGRTFYGAGQPGKAPAVVLEPDQAWEQGALSGPSVLSFGGEYLLYYAGGDGIGVARSTDGLAFRKEPGPVLGRDPAPGSWETTPPRAPSVFELPNGRLRMLYAAANCIGEAESTDGVAWSRVGTTPVLVPAPPPAPGSLLPNEKPPFDTAAVGDPYVATRTTPAGRFHVRVVYTGMDTAGVTAIGLAGRYGESGQLDRQPVAVYSVNQHEAAPALLDRGDSSYLYVQQERKAGDDPTYPAIAAAFAPGNVTLPPAGDFPDGP